LIWTDWKEFRKNCDNQKLININKTQESASLSRVSKLLLKICIKLFTNSEISHMIDTEDREMTLKLKTRKNIQCIKEKSQWNCTSCYISSDMWEST